LLAIENALNIFTNGSSRSSPRTGGIGIRFVIINSSGEEKIKDFDFDGYKGTTNNQMELYACNMALKEMMNLDLPPNVTKVVIHSDSLYVKENYKKAMFEWPKTHWFTHSGRPVLNADLWKVFVKNIKNIRMPFEVRWVKGHSISEHNRAADRLARLSSKRPFNKALTHVNVRRKNTDKKVEVGSVEMNGQRITIRIVTSEYLSIQKLWKYRYEVVSRRCIYRGNVDFVFSNHFLSTGHTYYVKVNSNTNNPRIEKVFHEIKPETADKTNKTNGGQIF
jgi:ribonuclease HI